jgi:hypothetical protein
MNLHRTVRALLERLRPHDFRTLQQIYQDYRSGFVSAGRSANQHVPAARPEPEPLVQKAGVESREPGESLLLCGGRAFR